MARSSSSGHHFDKSFPVLDERPDLSIVVPVYYNEQDLPFTVPALLGLATDIGTVELVLVDDGSGDGSYSAMRELQAQFPDRIQLVKLSRNFGSMAAILAGLAVARGRAVGMISADLQDPPELFIEMHSLWRQGCKAIFAVRAERPETGFSRWSSDRFYALMRRFALKGYPPGGFDQFLVDRQLSEAVVAMQEKNTNIMSLLFWMGYSPKLIPYKRVERRFGRSRWTFAKKLKFFVDSFVAFSYAPVRIMTITGVVLSLASFIYVLVLVIYKAVYGLPVAGFATLASLVAFFAGIQMLMIGTLGEYLWRTLDETRKRPPYIIDEIRPSVQGPIID